MPVSAAQRAEFNTAFQAARDEIAAGTNPPTPEEEEFLFGVGSRLTIIRRLYALLRALREIELIQ